jgi:amino acid permease
MRDRVRADAFFSRDELLGGLPARRASTVLFAIESLVAALVAESDRAAEPLLNETSAAAHAGTFLAALAHGRTARARPDIWALERYAAQWANLVPTDPGVRAATAWQLGQRERFALGAVPDLRAALGLDTPEVQAAFQRSYGQPLASTDAPGAQPITGTWPGWARVATWVERLPPFWTSFALTLTELVGGTMLALPIATAGLGPLPGVVVIIVLGLLNLLTIVALTEACTRSGPVRYGGAYFGGMVRGYLGATAAVVFSAVLFLDVAVALLAYDVGITVTLAHASGLPPLAWAAIIVATQIVLLRRGLHTTFAASLAVGAVNLMLLFTLILLSSSHMQPAYLLYAHIPFTTSPPADPRLFGAVVGVILLAYSGHISTPTCATLVLRRDPSGRALMAGSATAMGVVISLYSLWTTVMGSVIAPEVLAGETGTVLTPLAAIIGPIVHLLGAIFVVLSMGMASMHVTLALSGQFVEWLPARLRATGGGWLGTVPNLAIFLLVAWLFVTGQASFVGIVGLFCTLTLTLFAGVFPALLLLAARRRGEYVPGRPLGLLGHPAILLAVVAFFLGILLLHGLVIWERPFDRTAASSAAAGIALLAADTFRRGRFAPRAVVELRVSAAGDLAVSVVAHGKALAVGSPTGARQVTVTLPITSARELKVWAHRATPGGGSEPLRAEAKLTQGDTVQRLAIGPPTGFVSIPFDGQVGELWVAITD